MQFFSVLIFFFVQVYELIICLPKALANKKKLNISKCARRGEEVKRRIKGNSDISCIAYPLNRETK